MKPGIIEKDSGLGPIRVGIRSTSRCLVPVARCKYGGATGSVSRPDLVVAITSPGTRRQNPGGTRCRYARAGIAEYLVFPGKAIRTHRTALDLADATVVLTRPQGLRTTGLRTCIETCRVLAAGDWSGAFPVWSGWGSEPGRCYTARLPSDYDRGRICLFGDPVRPVSRVRQRSRSPCPPPFMPRGLPLRRASRRACFCGPNPPPLAGRNPAVRSGVPARRRASSATGVPGFRCIRVWWRPPCCAIGSAAFWSTLRRATCPWPRGQRTCLYRTMASGLIICMSRACRNSVFWAWTWPSARRSGS